LKKKKWFKINCLHFSFFELQVTMVVTAGEDNEEGRKPLQISPVIFSSRAASGGGE
jgi:hypothetical protein